MIRLREPALERPYRMPLFPAPALFSLFVNAALLTAFVYEEPLVPAWAFALLGALTLLASWAAYRAGRNRAPNVHGSAPEA
ncbi:hypothetical protein [Sphingomonas sp.]|uniref:hypothetical protein n=1 Tax=Sphingomonas sp. TaxID=28214 RepID=UPI0025DA3324|nr:hypothetical protein [Sphingomonas sp.]